MKLILQNLKMLKWELLELNRIKKARGAYLQKEMENPGYYGSLNAFDYYQCVFIHIPKAAGVSILYALFGNLGGGHMTFKEYSYYFSPLTLKRYFKFTIVRNPYDRLYSAYTFLKNGGFHDLDKEWAEKHLTRFNSFEDFVLNGLAIDPEVQQWIHFKPQVWFLKNAEGHIDLNFIGKFENLEQDFEYITSQLKSKAKLKHLNHSSTEVNSKVTYTAHMNAVVNTIYKEDFDKLGYLSR